MHKLPAILQLSNKLPKNQLPFPKDVIVLLMLFMDPPTLLQFMHSHRFPFHLAHKVTTFQRSYLLRHITTSEITVQQILTLPSEYHAPKIGGFAYHVQNAAHLWGRIPKPKTFWQSLLSYFSQAHENHDYEWLALLTATAENYDILLRSILPKSHFLIESSVHSDKKGLILLNEAAIRDQLESFKFLYETIGFHEQHTSNCFSHKTLQCYSGVTNFVNSAMVFRTLDASDSRLDIAHETHCNSDELSEKLTQLVTQRIGSKSKVLQYLVDTMQGTEPAAAKSRHALAESLLAFCKKISHTKDLPDLLILHVVELFRLHGKSIFTDYRAIQHIQLRLFLVIIDRCNDQLPDQFDLYLLQYACELVEAKIFTAENLNGTFMRDLETKTLSLRSQQVETFSKIRAAKIAILTDIWQTLSRDAGPRVLITPVTTFDTGPYLQSAVRSMIDARRKLMQTGSELIEAYSVKNNL